ncbi:MAG: hypothetical protein D6791_04950 [Chloroflexi bacterium]|nr:MAG: hypothetical protein D6791_04950 [Chloroflexota bacterium]
MLEKMTTNGSQNSAVTVSAHELQNLLCVIIAEAQLLQLNHAADDPDYRSALAIERAGRRLEALLYRLIATWGTEADHIGQGEAAVPQNTDAGPHAIMKGTGA